MTYSRRAFSTLAAFFVASTAFSLAGCGDNKTADGSSGTTPGGDSGKATNATPQKLVFGFVPSVEADKIAENAQPMADFLTKELGIPVETYTSTQYAGLIEAMGSGKVDIGSLPTLAYVLAKDKDAAEVMLKTRRKGAVTYHSMFITRADSGITKIEDAKGKKIAFVDAASASGYLVPAAYLKKKGIDPETFFAQPIFSGAHDSAVRAVYNGDVDVAAVYDDARNKLEKDPATKDVKTKVVKIGVTNEIPNDTISVRSGLDPALVAKIKAALLKYADTPEGKKVLDEVYEVDGLVDAKDSDYDPVREIAKYMNVEIKDVEKKAPSPAAPSASPAAKK